MLIQHLLKPNVTHKILYIGPYDHPDFVYKMKKIIENIKSWETYHTTRYDQIE